MKCYTPFHREDGPFGKPFTYSRGINLVLKEDHLKQSPLSSYPTLWVVLIMVVFIK